MLKIEVDFNTKNSDPENRVLIPTHIQPELEKILVVGMQVILYEPDDFEVKAIVEYGASQDCCHNYPRYWYGRPDWTTLRYFGIKDQ